MSAAHFSTEKNGIHYEDFNMMVFPAANSNTEAQKNRLIPAFQGMVQKLCPTIFYRQHHLIYLRVLPQQCYLMWLIWDAFEYVMRM